MHFLRSICLFASLFAANTLILAQPATETTREFSEKELKHYDELFVKAEEALYREDFETALPYYEELVRSGLNYGNMLYYHAELCSLLTNYQSKSLQPFLTHEEEMSLDDKFYYYWKGRVQMRKYQMEEARNSLLQFLDTDVYLSKEIKEESRKWVTWVNNADTAMKHPDPFEINLLKGISSEVAELSPVYFLNEDELLFLSNRDTTEDVFRIFHSYRDSEEKWSTPALIENLGTFTRENANIQLISENKRLYQYREDKGGGLYYSVYSEETEEWSTPIPLTGKLSPDDLGSRFFITKEQDRIIYAKEVGTRRFPNLDLMESRLDKTTGEWSKPTSISDQINSEFNEDEPYLSKDGRTLFFASDGHGSIGGYDIFKSIYDPQTDTWSKPINMGFPVNSPDDERQFRMNPDGKGGYFTSNRLNTFGDYDIFFFWDADRIDIEGLISVEGSESVIDSAEIYFRPFDYLDMYFYSGILRGKYRTQINAKGTFEVEIRQNMQTIFKDTITLDTVGGFGSIRRDFSIPYNVEDPVVQLLLAKQFEPDAAVREVQNEKKDIVDLPTKPRHFDHVVLSNIYFETAKTNVKDSVALHAVLKKLKTFSSLSITIEGHTDNVGGDRYNLNLSKARAERVKNWLIDRGIGAERINAVGYGYRKPLATNDDEKEGRELNRRIEIVVDEGQERSKMVGLEQKSDDSSGR